MRPQYTHPAFRAKGQLLLVRVYSHSKLQSKHDGVTWHMQMAFHSLRLQ